MCTDRIMSADFKDLFSFDARHLHSGDLSKTHLKVKEDTFSFNKDLKDKTTDNKANSIVTIASDK